LLFLSLFLFLPYSVFLGHPCLPVTQEIWYSLSLFNSVFFIYTTWSVNSVESSYSIRLDSVSWFYSILFDSIQLNLNDLLWFFVSFFISLFFYFSLSLSLTFSFLLLRVVLVTSLYCFLKQYKKFRYYNTYLVFYIDIFIDIHIMYCFIILLYN
jgi:hypothetical protein